jgi:hypothetical protein
MIRLRFIRADFHLLVVFKNTVVKGLSIFNLDSKVEYIGQIIIHKVYNYLNLLLFVQLVFRIFLNSMILG